MTEDAADLRQRLNQATLDLLLAHCDVRMWRDRSDSWQALAGRYDDVRGWLRVCEDNPAGHAEFYRECCVLIFGQANDDDDEEESE